MRMNGVSGFGRKLARATALALVTGMAAAGGHVGHAVAQERGASLSIPAGPLSGALNALAAQSGLQIGFDSAVVRGLSTPGLSGTYTADAALAQLLAGSGLTYAYSGPRTVVVQAAAADAAGGDVVAYESGATVLGPIIVQGEKIARDMFSTYTSAAIATAQDIDDTNSTTIGQTLNRMANVRSYETGSGNSSFVIRGLNADGVTQPSRAAPVISVVVDGAQQGVEATRRGTRGVWDVEQIEVLRGPQSTLQGRNSLAGSVLVKTKDPTWTPEFAVEGLAGSNDFASGAFALSAPIFQDQLAFRIAGQAWKSRKDIEYSDPAIASLGEDRFEEIRGKLLFTPEALPGFTGLFTISHTHDKPAWGLVSGPDFFARRFTDFDGSTAEYRDTFVNRYIADLSYEITPEWTVRSVTSLADTDVRISTPDGSAFIRDDTRDGSDLSHDMRVTYESPDSPFSGVFGVFAGRFRNDLKSHIQTTLLAPYGVPLIDVQVLDAKNRTESIAAYADMRYEFADRWTAMAGGRILHDTVSADYRGYALNIDETLATGMPVFGSLDENNSISNTVFLPKLGLAFDFTDNQTLAVTASRGYRAGFSEAVAGTTQINTVEPEYLWSYELAYRSKWLDDRLQFNGNVFYYDYRNQQILTYNPNFPGQTVTANSARSHAYGAEIEARYQATPSLELFSSLGLLKTRFDEGVTANGIDLTGREFPEAPTVTASIGALWRHESGFFVGADVSYTDGYYSAGDLANTPGRFVDSFTLVNAQLGYENENFSATAFAKNIFDKQYLTAVLDGGGQAVIGDGRSFGFKLTGKF